MAFSYPHLLLNLQPVLDWMPPEKNNNSFQLWILPFVIRFESPSQRRGISFSVFFHREKRGHAGRAGALLHSMPARCCASFPGHDHALACHPVPEAETLKCHLHELVRSPSVIYAGDCKRSCERVAAGWIKRRSFQWVLTRANVKLTPQPFAHSPSSSFLSKQVGFFFHNKTWSEELLSITQSADLVLLLKSPSAWWAWALLAGASKHRLERKPLWKVKSRRANKTFSEEFESLIPKKTKRSADLSTWPFSFFF